MTLPLLSCHGTFLGSVLNTPQCFGSPSVHAVCGKCRVYGLCCRTRATDDLFLIPVRSYDSNKTTQRVQKVEPMSGSFDVMTVAQIKAFKLAMSGVRLHKGTQDAMVKREWLDKDNFEPTKVGYLVLAISEFTP